MTTPTARTVPFKTSAITKRKKNEHPVFYSPSVPMATLLHGFRCISAFLSEVHGIFIVSAVHGRLYPRRKALRGVVSLIWWTPSSPNNLLIYYAIQNKTPERCSAVDTDQARILSCNVEQH